ncbi:MAG: mannose-6-phosphate isomerase, class I [Acidimicrobiales bacterium]
MVARRPRPARAAALAPLRLRGALRHYDWGSQHDIPELIGARPDGRPWAELWLGAHPAAPAVLEPGHGEGGEVSLRDAIAADPERMLGAACCERYGLTLPFLVKVLAVERPLSLQVHPTLSQAREGFAREEAAGVPLEDERRVYRDAEHKPELLCALSEFEALAGFATLDHVVLALGALGLDRLAERAERQGLARLFWWLWDQPSGEQASLVEAAVAGARAADGGLFSAEAGWVRRLAELHPGDVGVVASVLLNLVRLAPGEALYAPAGRLHAYLRGVGVEIMASSDNVVRGGLTSKRVDLVELRRILRVAPEAALVQQARAGVYDTPAPEFRLSRLELAEGELHLLDVRGPEVLVCTAGRATLDGLPLERGQAAFVPGSLTGIAASGEGIVFRAEVNPDA